MVAQLVFSSKRRPGSPDGQSKEHLINNSTCQKRVLLVFPASSVGSGPLVGEGHA